MGLLALVMPGPGASANQSLLLVNQDIIDWVLENYGDEASKRVIAWDELMRVDSQENSDTVKMANTNDFFNQVRWLSDSEHWGQEDYWATPIETLATNGGDCEDYSIGKYFSLQAVNVENAKLRITYVKSLTYNQAHMVLAYYSRPEAEPLILDNINGTILPASQRPDLLPIYSFNGENLWLAKSRGRNAQGNSMKSLPNWRSLNERMKKMIK